MNLIISSLGKSATGNSLLHSRTAFRSEQTAKSVTKDCEMKTNTCMDIHGRQKKLIVVDTPGFFDSDTSVSNEMVKKKIASQIFEMTSPGVHAFLILLRIDVRITPEEKDTINFIETIFGKGAAKYCIVVFTRGNLLQENEQTLEEFIQTSPDLRELVQKCGDRKFAINNKSSDGPLETQTKKLLDMIDRTVESNGRTYYTNDEYERIEKQRKEKKAKEEQEARDKKKAYDDALIAKVIGFYSKDRVLKNTHFSILGQRRNEKRNAESSKSANGCNELSS